MLNRSRVALALAISALATLSLSSCGSTPSTTAGDGGTTPSAGPARTDAVEASAAQPRLAVAHEGGVLVLDAVSGEVLLEEELEGFVRLNPAGDGRHVLVSGAGGFTVLDTGAWTDSHGDHGHSWTGEARLTGVTLPAEEPGHAVAHHGRTILFDDGTGVITAFDPADLADAASIDDLDIETFRADRAHHGVAVQDGHGNLTLTVGDEEVRTGVRVQTPEGAPLASSQDCPGVHGEAHAGDVAVFGCEDGVLVVDGTGIRKVDSPDAYGRIGNQAGHDASPYVLGDYKVDPDAELERPTRVAVVDTRDASLRLVDLPASYTFRSLGRTPSGDGLVLGTDGRLHVIDTRAARVRTSIEVLSPWREPLDWQAARPLLEVAGDVAYVTDPASRTLAVVDLAQMVVVRSVELPVVPQELVAVTG